jgi:enoyl-CoA hydratase
MRLALLAERLPATDALEWGLVSAVYPAEDFDAEVDKTLAGLLAGPAAAFAKTKHAINAATLCELDATLDREYVGQSILLNAHDFREGTRAFQDRRTPKFTDF